MNTYEIYSIQSPKHSGQSFLEIVRYSKKHVIGDKFIIHENQIPHTKAFLVSKITLRVDELKSFHTYLDKDCNLDTWLKIKELKRIDKYPSTHFDMHLYVDVMVFSLIVSLNPIKYHAPTN